MSLGTEESLGPDDIVLDGDPAPPGKGQSGSYFSAHVFCGQTVAHLSNGLALVTFNIEYVGTLLNTKL